MSKTTEKRICLGSDICSVKRIGQVYEKYGARFLNKILSKNEQKYVLGKPLSRTVEVIAGRFAAKEALSKALGTGWRGVHWQEVEIINAESGAPQVILHGRAAERLTQLGCHRAEISISHERENAFAVALLY